MGMTRRWLCLCLCVPALVSVLSVFYSYYYLDFKFNAESIVRIDDNGIAIYQSGLRTNTSNEKGIQAGIAAFEISEKERLDASKRVEANNNTLMIEMIDAAREKAPQVITIRGVEEMNNFINRYWKGNLFCEIMAERNTTHSASRPTLFNVSFGCRSLFQYSDCGTGNFISILYGIRLAAQSLGNVDVVLTCHDALQQRNSLILPWLMGFFPESSQPSPYAYRESDACGNYDEQPVGRMLQDMRFELRRMAIALVGIPHKDHPSAAFAEKYLWSDKNSSSRRGGRFLQLPDPQRNDPPLYPNVTLDDAILHFRCGDLMSTLHPSFGFIKFSALAQHISPQTRSIGIVTQPFAKDAQQRRGDARNVDRCRIVVNDFLKYLQERFPNSNVRIHNDRSETIALTYARMIMANQTIAGISTFGVFPALVNFGTGYIRKPDYRKAPNKFLLNPPIDTLTNEAMLFEAPQRLMARNVRSMWQQDNTGKSILEWFRNDTL